MNVPEGFKQTEVGVIPQDWEVVALGELTEKVGSGITPTGGQRVYKEDGRPFMRSQNVGWGSLLLDDVAFIDDATHATFLSTEIQLHDVFLNITGASIGRSAIADSRVVFGNVNQHVCIIRTDNSKLSPRFLNYFLLSANGQMQIDVFQAGGNRQGLNFSQVRSIRIAKPKNIKEQTAIAAALSDMDALIEGVEKLLEKKRRIKQGAMQELLRPKEGWRKKKLGELFEINAGGDVEKEFFSNRTDEKYPYPIYSNSLSNYGLYGYSSHFTSDGNCITVTARGTIGYACFRDHRFAAIGRLLILRPKLDVDCFYISEFINNKIKFAFEVTGVPQLTAPQISKYDVWISDKKSEQTAIAAVLSDMDSEIEQLETQLTKYRQLKTGMMQELLTGKKRLL